MPFYKINGMVMHIKFGGKKHPPAPCVALVGLSSADRKAERCSDMSEFLCDWPFENGKTCDAPLCRSHANEVGKNRHYCPVHLAQHNHQQPQLALFTALERPVEAIAIPEHEEK